LGDVNLEVIQEMVRYLRKNLTGNFKIFVVELSLKARYIKVPLSLKRGERLRET
jgi:hypothetical protein